MYGTTEFATERATTIAIVQRQAGTNYDVEDKIVVIGDRLAGQGHLR